MPDVSEVQGVDQHTLANQNLVDPLTKREIEILKILMKKYSNPEIAEKLFISPETVKRHLYNVYQKFGVENRKQAIAKALELTKNNRVAASKMLGIHRTGLYQKMKKHGLC